MSKQYSKWTKFWCYLGLHVKSKAVVTEVMKGTGQYINNVEIKEKQCWAKYTCPCCGAWQTIRRFGF